MFEIYESYYKMGLFTKDDLDNFVKAMMLTSEEEQKILGAAA